MGIIYRSFLIFHFIKHLKLEGVKILRQGKTPTLDLLNNLAKFGAVRSLKMTRIGLIYKGQKVSKITKDDFKILRKSFSIFGPVESYMIEGKGPVSGFQSKVYTGKKRFAADLNRLRGIILDLEDEAQSTGQHLESITIKHVHPSLEIIGNDGVVLHPLTKADIEVRERLELLVGIPVKVEALTPSFLKYSI